jgi:ketosteroid isomerase-like protein
MVGREMTPEQTLNEMSTAGKDLNKFLSFIADDAVFWFSNETSHVGREQIGATLKRNADLTTEYTYESGPLQWLAQTDSIAVCIYPFHWTGKVNEQQAEGRGRATRVLEKRNGQWLLIHEHLSRGPVK